MGERALARCERPDGRHDVFYSQWAGDGDLLLRVLRGGRDGLGVLERLDWERRGSVPSDGVVERLDYLSTAVVYDVSVQRVRVRLPVWLGLDSLAHDGGPLPPGFGALIPVRDVAAAVRVRLGTRWLREAAARAVEAGVLPVHAAVKLLILSLLPPPGGLPAVVTQFLEDGSLPAGGSPVD